MKLRIGLLVAATVLTPDAVYAQRNAPVDAPFILEHNYWLQNGKVERFVALFNKNKLPLLTKELEEGRILYMRFSRPRLSSREATQPDFRLTIAWRNPVVAWDNVDPSRFVQSLFPDVARWRAEEAEREQLVISRADVPIQEHTMTPQK